MQLSVSDYPQASQNLSFNIQLETIRGLTFASPFERFMECIIALLTWEHRYLNYSYVIQYEYIMLHVSAAHVRAIKHPSPL